MFSFSLSRYTASGLGHVPSVASVSRRGPGVAGVWLVPRSGLSAASGPPPRSPLLSLGQDWDPARRGHGATFVSMAAVVSTRGVALLATVKPPGPFGLEAGWRGWPGLWFCVLGPVPSQQLVAPCACGDVPSLGTAIRDCDCSVLGLKQGSPGPPFTLQTEGLRPGWPRRPCPGHTAPAPAAKHRTRPGQCP